MTTTSPLTSSRLRMTDNQCYEADGHVPAGELIAQTTIYHSAPFHRIG